MQILRKRYGIDNSQDNRQNNVLYADKTEEEPKNKISEVNLTAAGLRCLKGIQEIINIKYITILWLSENPIKYLTGIQLFSNLEELNIDYCKVQSLNPLRQLHKLKKLSVDSNEIKSIEPLSDLRNLEWLDLGFNQIESLSGLENLHCLCYLDIDKNRINNIQELKKLQGCKTLERLCIKSQLDGIDNELGDYKEFVKQNLPQVAFLDVDAEMQWLTI